MCSSRSPSGGPGRVSRGRPRSGSPRASRHRPRPRRHRAGWPGRRLRRAAPPPISRAGRSPPPGATLPDRSRRRRRPGPCALAAGPRASLVAGSRSGSADGGTAAMTARSPRARRRWPAGASSSGHRPRPGYSWMPSRSSRAATSRTQRVSSGRSRARAEKARSRRSLIGRASGNASLVTGSSCIEPDSSTSAADCRPPPGRSDRTRQPASRRAREDHRSRDVVVEGPERELVDAGGLDRRRFVVASREQQDQRIRPSRRATNASASCDGRSSHWTSSATTRIGVSAAASGGQGSRPGRRAGSPRRPSPGSSPAGGATGGDPLDPSRRRRR